MKIVFHCIRYFLPGKKLYGLSCSPTLIFFSSFGSPFLFSFCSLFKIMPPSIFNLPFVILKNHILFMDWTVQSNVLKHTSKGGNFFFRVDKSSRGLDCLERNFIDLWQTSIPNKSTIQKFKNISNTTTNNLRKKVEALIKLCRFN